MSHVSLSLSLVVRLCIVIKINYGNRTVCPLGGDIELFSTKYLLGGNDGVFYFICFYFKIKGGGVVVN